MANNNEGANGIYNDGACIRILVNKNTFEINKCQIKTIDTMRNDVVRLDIGEGALKNIYIRLADITFPQVFTNVEELRDYIKSLMTLDGFSTESKQDITILELQQIKLVLQNIKLAFQENTGASVSAKLPLREDESQPNIVYKGYAAAKVETTEAKWAIQKISRIDNQIIYEWADGDENFDNVWENRLTLLYFPSGYVA